MSPYTIVLCKFTRVLVKKQLESQQRQLGITVVMNTGAYIVSMNRKTTVYRLEAGKITFSEKCVQAVHSNAFPYFTGLPVSSSFIVAEPGFIIQYDTVQAPCDTLV